MKSMKKRCKRALRMLKSSVKLVEGTFYLYKARLENPDITHEELDTLFEDIMTKADILDSFMSDFTK